MIRNKIKLLSLKKALNSLAPDISERIRFIGKVASELGYSACVIGGFVRDLLLGRDNFDLDIVVEGDGINFARELSLRLDGSLFKHRRFGTATVVFGDRVKIDVATARQEVYEHPGSLPKVTPGTIKDDISRRDFSINAMGFNLGHKNFGELIDFFNGMDDLKNARVRVLHDLSFIDDSTRILRAIRFEQRYDFKIESHTLRLLRQAIAQDCFSTIQKQRLRDELILLLKESNAYKCIRRVNELCGFGFIHPGINISSERCSLLARAAKAYEWFSNHFPQKRKVELWLVYLAIILEDLDSRQTTKVLEEFAFRRGEKKIILSFVQEAESLALRLKKRLAPSQIYKILDPITYEVMLLMVVKASSPVIIENIENFFAHYNEVKIQANGEDLKGLGLKPGPHYNDILRRILYAKLDNKLKTKEEELSFLKGKIIKPDQ